jgi:hypothetical protein
MSKPQYISIPVKFFHTFIQASSKWLSRTNDAKRGLELRIAQVAPDRMEFSTGADSHFIKMVVLAEPFELPEPVFLDLQYFQNLALGGFESLHFVRPKEINPLLDEKRAQFKAPGMNFRIPLRTGDVWRRNQFDPSSLKIEDSQRIELSEEHAARLIPLWDLPDSFGTKTGGALQLAVAAQSPSLRVWSSDAFAAFQHEFTNVVAPSDLNRALKLNVNFLQPYGAVDWEHKFISLCATERLLWGEVLPYREGPLLFSWTAPQQQGVLPDIEKALAAERVKVQHAIDFDTASFCQNLARATAFYQDRDYMERPLELSLIGKQYHLVGRLAQSEIVAEGESLTAPESNLKVMVQPRCLLDYTKRFQSKKPLRLEVTNQTALLVQNSEQGKLQYWLPITER